MRVPLVYSLNHRMLSLDEGSCPLLIHECISSQGLSALEALDMYICSKLPNGLLSSANLPIELATKCKEENKSAVIACNQMCLRLGKPEQVH